MKDCTRCKWADWERTESGRLHQSGDGRCTKMVYFPQIPASYYWVGTVPKPSGGFINRRKSLRTHCPYWSSTDGGGDGNTNKENDHA